MLSELDTLSYDDVALRAEPLTRGDSALELMAVELKGVSAIRNQRWDEARSHYERIQFSLDAPQNMSRRATEALALINQNAPVLEEETISGEEDASPAVTPEESPEQALDADAETETETQPDPQEEG